MSTPSDAAVIRAANRLHHKDGVLEIATVPSDNLVVRCEGGAYVCAWIWIDDDDVRPSDEIARKGDAS